MMDLNQIYQQQLAQQQQQQQLATQRAAEAEYHRQQLVQQEYRQDERLSFTPSPGPGVGSAGSAGGRRVEAETETDLTMYDLLLTDSEGDLALYFDLSACENKVLSIAWGDGSTETYTADEEGGINAHHDYISPGAVKISQNCSSTVVAYGTSYYKLKTGDLQQTSIRLLGLMGLGYIATGALAAQIEQLFFKFCRLQLENQEEMEDVSVLSPGMFDHHAALTALGFIACAPILRVDAGTFAGLPALVDLQFVGIDFDAPTVADSLLTELAAADIQSCVVAFDNNTPRTTASDEAVRILTEDNHCTLNNLIVV